VDTSYLDHPFHLDAKGRAATTEVDDHVKDMIFQVLFTNPGERVNRPDFGCGLLQLVFMPNSDALATATQFMVQGSLQRWLGDVIQVEQVLVTSEEERLVVDVGYVRLDNGQRRQERFASPTGSGQ
jgi:phage baseplate assembly protein W